MITGEITRCLDAAGARPDRPLDDPPAQAAVEIMAASVVVVPWVAMCGFQGCLVVTTAWSWRRIAAAITA
ncbi:hypothetical protein ACWEO2_18485 [Nocardia sp. NPDC004278]